MKINLPAKALSSLLATLFSVLGALGQDDYSRKYTFYEDMSGVLTPRVIDFYQGERVELTINMLRSGLPIDLSGQSYTPVWGIIDGSTGTNQVMISKTGEVFSATGGVIRFVIPPSESVVTSSVYSGYVTMTRFSGTNIADRGTVQRQSVTVRESID
jgi:hypothetical protein